MPEYLLAIFIEENLGWNGCYLVLLRSLSVLVNINSNNFYLSFIFILNILNNGLHLLAIAAPISSELHHRRHFLGRSYRSRLALLRRLLFRGRRRRRCNLRLGRWGCSRAASPGFNALAGRHF